MKQKLLRLVAIAAMWVPVLLAFAEPTFAQTRNDFRDLTLPIVFTSNPDSFLDLLGVIIRFVLFIGGLIAFFYVIYGGFIYLTSGGDPGKASGGQKIIVNAIIGIIIIFISYALVNFLVNRIGDAGGGANNSRRL